MVITGPGIPVTPLPDVVTGFNIGTGGLTGSITIKYAALSDNTNVTITINGDNGGTSFVNSVGTCFHRISQTYSQVEWGVYGDKIHDDTSFLQNWMNAVQPHIAVPGNSRITHSLVCGYGGLTNTVSIQGSPVAVGQSAASSMPTFNIYADKNSWNDATDPQMFLMSGGPSCTLHGVGLIANATTTHPNIYDTVLIGGSSGMPGNNELIDGHSLLSGGYINLDVNVHGGADIEVYDNAINNSVSDNIHLLADANAKIMRNVIDTAGMGNSAQGAGGNNITLGNGSASVGDIAIENNSIGSARGWGLQAQSARLLRIVGNVFPENGMNQIGAGAIDLKNVANSTICGNTFELSGAYSEGSGTPTANIFFEGVDDSISLCGNTYSVGNTNSYIAIRPDYNYDADPNAQLTNITIADNPAAQNMGVLSPNAQKLLRSSTTPHNASNYLTGLTLSATGALTVNINPGEASDSTGSTIISRPSGCSVDLTQGGAGGLDTGAGMEAANTTYFLFLISGYGGANPSCIASTSLTPSFLNTTGYSLAVLADTTAGSPIIFNATAPLQGSSNVVGSNPLAGFAVGDAITGPGIPLGASIASLSSFYIPPATGTWTGGTSTEISGISNALTNVAPYMSVGTPANSSTSNFSIPQGDYIITVCTSLECQGGTCSPAPCIILNQAPTCMGACTCPSPSACTIDIGGNFTMTLGATQTATATAQQITANVFDGYYRMIGALNTGAGSPPSLVSFTQNNDTFYSAAPMVSTAGISSEGPSTIIFPSLPGGISVRAFGRCVGGPATGTGHVLIYSPGQTAILGNAHAFPAIPGYAVTSLIPDTAFPFSAWTDTSKSLRVVSDVSGLIQCMLDGWELKRSP